MDDELLEDYHAGRRAMIAAFADLSTDALRAGVDEGKVTDAQERFFDGNKVMKSAVTVIALYAQVRDWR